MLAAATAGLERGAIRTKSSSAAVPNVAFFGEAFMVADMSTRSREASLLNSASKVDRNGLRDMGLLSELERWAMGGEGRAGEAALLRKGLLEGRRLGERPGDGRLSADKEGYQRRPNPPGWARVKRPGKGALPGIDGAANMMLALATTLLGGPIKARLGASGSTAKGHV